MLSLGQYFVIVLSTYFEEDVINLVFDVATFIAMHSYPCRLVLWSLALYRLENFLRISDQ